jgi:hypothetical protein
MNIRIYLKTSHSWKILATCKISEITRRERRKNGKNNIKSGHYILTAMTKNTIRTSLGPIILALVSQE